MRFASLALAGLAAAAVLAPLSAQADPDWGRRYDDHTYYGNPNGRDHDGRDRDRNEGREREWREHHRDWGWNASWGGYAYRRHCWTEQRGYYEPDGDYVSRPVTVCR